MNTTKNYNTARLDFDLAVMNVARVGEQIGDGSHKM